MEKRQAINFLYFHPYSVSSSKKPPHANELSSLQMKRGTVDTFCGRSSSPSSSDYELDQGNKKM